MDTNNLSKEFILNLFFKFYPEILKKLTGYKIENLELEKGYFGRKIDGYAKNDDREIFLESQLNTTDVTHLNQILFIIENTQKMQDITIVWVAKKIREEMIDEVEKKIKDTKKNIEFIGVNINEEMLEELNRFSDIGEFEIIDNLGCLASVSKLEVVSRQYRRFVEKCEGNDEDIDAESDSTNKGIDKYINEKEEIMERIVEEVRRQMHYNPSVHRERKMEGNILVLGAGISDVNYTIGVNRYSQIFTELKFQENTKNIFDLLLENKEEIDDFFDYFLEWDEGTYKLFTSNHYKDDIDRIIKMQVRLLEKIIIWFTKYKRQI